MVKFFTKMHVDKYAAFNFKMKHDTYLIEEFLLLYIVLATHSGFAQIPFL